MRLFFTYPLFFACLILFSSFPGNAAAAGEPNAAHETPARLDKGSPTLIVYMDNDLFYNEDRYYTNAVQIRLISPDLSSLDESQVLPSASGVPFPGRAEASQFNLSLGAGQHIYTPQDTDIQAAQPDDRPYAGYLYGLLALHAKQANRLDTLELAAGIIGPSALGEQAQNGVHRIRSLDTAKGWKHQLHDEPALMLTWSRIWRLNPTEGDGWGYDFLPRLALSAGTPFTNASLGGEVRFGWNLPPDYGTSGIRPGSGITAPAGEASLPGRDSLLDNLSFYFFLGCEGKAVAHNTFLDGNLWKDSHSVDKYPLVGELSAGITLSIYRFRATYSYVHRTDEFHGQDSGQNYGSITISYAF